MLAGSANAMYLVGDPAGAWNPTKGIEMTQVENGWQWKGTITGNQYFAFATQLCATENWDEFNDNYRISPDENNTIAKSGEYPMHIGRPDTSFRGDGVHTLSLRIMANTSSP